MKHLIFILFVLIIFTGCEEKYEEKVHYPSHTYEYINIDTSVFPLSQNVYVPIYSHIYNVNGKTVHGLTATLSIRSMSFKDSLFITKVDYYGSDGKMIKKYVEKTLLLKPMNSVEFIVEEKESEGGAGANFVVTWAGRNGATQPLVQAVMLSTYDRSGISFVVDGIPMQK